jgi:6-phosphogluconolactonase (cycloisomerase 2 family)
MLTRRSFITTMIASAATARWSAAEGSAETLIYMSSGGSKTGGTGGGIHAGRWNSRTGTISDDRQVVDISTSFMTISHRGSDRFLYAGHQTGKGVGGLSGYRIAPGGDLRPVNTVTAPDAGFTHLACDHTGHCIVAPNYGSGFTLSTKIGEDGRLSEFVSRIKQEGHGPIADRQTGPHPHGVAIAPNNRFAYINDLGADRIFIFRLDVAAGSITPADPALFQMPAGSGPRHLAFHPNGKWAYSINELNSTLTLLHWNATTGALTTIAETPTMSEGGDVAHNRAGEIAFDLQGRFLYCCNRGAVEELPIFRVGSEGRLTFVARIPLQGTEARHFVVSPDDGYLVVANQFSNAISVFQRDRSTGLLSLREEKYPLEGASCVVFA